MSNEKTAEEILAGEVEKVEAVIDATAAVVTAAHEKYSDIIGEVERTWGGFSFKALDRDFFFRASMQDPSAVERYALRDAGTTLFEGCTLFSSIPELMARTIATMVAGYYKSAPGPVNEDPFLLPEDEIAEFMRQRIEDGEWDAEDIPARLARFGLMDPAQFRAEMAERIALRAEEAAE